MLEKGGGRAGPQQGEVSILSALPFPGCEEFQVGNCLLPSLSVGDVVGWRASNENGNDGKLGSLIASISETVPKSESGYCPAKSSAPAVCKLVQKEGDKCWSFFPDSNSPKSINDRQSTKVGSHR